MTMIKQLYARLARNLRSENNKHVPPSEPDVLKGILIPRSRRGDSPKVLMIMTMGLETDAFAATIETIQSQRRPDLEPVIVTDRRDFRLLRRHRLVFEYFPSPESQRRFAPDMPWDLYRVRRLGRIRRKWAPVRIVAFGSISRQYLQELSVSPFEDPSIVDIIGTASSNFDGDGAKSGAMATTQ